MICDDNIIYLYIGIFFKSFFVVDNAVVADFTY